jgi:hypothetical protein
MKKINKQRLIRYLVISITLGVAIFPFIKAFIPLPDEPIIHWSEEGGAQGFIPSVKDFSSVVLTCLIALWLNDKMAKENKD